MAVETAPRPERSSDATLPSLPLSYKPVSPDAGLSRACGGELTVSRRIVNDREACGAARRPMTALIP